MMFVDRFIILDIIVETDLFLSYNIIIYDLYCYAYLSSVF